MICPVCGPKGCKEWHICVLHESKPVCEDCCSACRYRKGYRCGYRRDVVDHREEIYKLSRQITALEEKADYYYSRGWARSADKLITEAGRLKAKRREYEKIQKDRQGTAGDH